MSARLAGLGPWIARPRAQHVVLLAIIGLVTALCTHYAWRYHTWQYDELGYVLSGRFIDQDFPGSLFNLAYLGRGIQRLNPFLLAGVFAVIRDSTAQFQVAHALEALAFASTAIPVYLLGRALGLGALALVPAALTVTVPWAVLSITFLNESVAYAATAWALLAIWHASQRVRPRNDVLALLAVALAGMARSNLLVLAGVLAVSVLIADLRATDGAHPILRARLRALPSRFLRGHWVLAVAGTAFLAYLISRGTGQLGGGYPVTLRPDTTVMWLKFRIYVAQLTEGLALVPVAIAAPWVLRELVRPRTRDTGAFAVIAVTTLLLLLYSTQGAGSEDRYMIGLVPIVFIAMTIAISRRQVHAFGVLITAVLLARCVDQFGTRPDQGAFDFFTYPAETFYRRVVLGQLSEHLPHFLAAHRGAFMLVVLLAILLVSAEVSRRRPSAASRVLAGVAVAVSAYGLAAANYSMSKFTTGAGEPAIGPGTRTFIDQLTGGDTAGILDVGGGVAYHPLWKELTYFNGSLRTVVSYTSFSYPQFYPSYQPVTVSADPETGRLTANLTLPHYLVTVPRYQQLGMNLERIGSATYLPTRIDVERFQGPPRATYEVSGPDLDGWMRPGATRATSIRVFTTGLAGQPGQCLSVLVTAPPFYTGARTISVIGPLGRQRIAFAAKQQRVVAIPLPAAPATSPYWTVRISANSANTLLDGRLVTAQLTSVAVGPCGGAQLG